MKIPLIVLAICVIAVGFLPIAQLVTSDGAALETHIDLVFSALPVTLAIVGILVATLLYKKASTLPDTIELGLGVFYTTAYRKFYIDEIYLFITKKIIFNLIGRPAAWMDKNIVDGFIILLANTTATISEKIKGFQSGKVQNYALYFFGGVIGLAVLFIYLWN